jgi:hypothetical protein
MGSQIYKTNRLSNNENRHFDVVTSFDYLAIAANATSANQVVVGEIPAGGGVQTVMVWEKTALVGASDITLDVGTTAGDPDEFINALDVDAMTAPVVNTGDAFDLANSAGLEIVGLTNTATDILAEWNGTVSSLTAGEVVIGIKYASLNGLG